MSKSEKKNSQSGAPNKFPFTVNSVEVAKSSRGVTATYAGHLLHKFSVTADPALVFHTVRAWVERDIAVPGHTVTVNLASGEAWDATTGKAFDL